MSYRFRQPFHHVGMAGRDLLTMQKHDLQRRLLIVRSEIMAEAERLGLTYDELLRLAREENA